VVCCIDCPAPDIQGSLSIHRRRFSYTHHKYQNTREMHAAFMEAYSVEQTGNDKTWRFRLSELLRAL
jgi:hypothetical protein